MKNNQSGVYIREKNLCEECSRTVQWCVNSVVEEIVSMEGFHIIIKCSHFLSKIQEFNKIAEYENDTQNCPVNKI